MTIGFLMSDDFRKCSSAVMEYANRGDMLQQVVHAGGFTERDSRWYFQQLMLGVDFAHKVRPKLNDTKSSESYHDLHILSLP